MDHRSSLNKLGRTAGHRRALLKSQALALFRYERIRTTMAKAKDMQYDATLMWEWWTAENSDGFHNPDLARKSLDNSMTSSRDAIKMLREAMAALKAPPAAPAK